MREVARESAGAVRKNESIDWTVKEGVRARLRVMVKRVLKDPGYPHSKRNEATQTVLQQTELLCVGWT